MCHSEFLSIQMAIVYSNSPQYDEQNLNKGQKARPVTHSIKGHTLRVKSYYSFKSYKLWHFIVHTYCFSTNQMGTLTCCSSKISDFEKFTLYARVCMISDYYGDSIPIWYNL